MAEENKKQEEIVEQVEDTQPTTEVTAIKMTANDRLKKRYPDQDPQTDEDWENLRNRFHDDTETAEKDFSALENEVNELISSDPDLALILQEMLVNKLPFRAALAKTIDITELTPAEGDMDYEAYSKAYDERVNATKERQRRQEEIDNNAIKSFETIDSYCEEKGYDDQTKQSIEDFINEVFDAIVMKNISRELLEQLDKARTYEADIAQAGYEGEVRGRNANIEAQRAEDIQEEEGDGIPTPSQAGGAPLRPSEENDSALNGFWDGIGGNKKWR